MLTSENFKQEFRVRQFASLDFRGQRFDWLQAYYSNLFDLWENPACDYSFNTDELLAKARWKVEDYAQSKGWYLERDSKWQVVMETDGEIHAPHDKHGTLFA
jgi:hypothetical protein